MKAACLTHLAENPLAMHSSAISPIPSLPQPFLARPRLSVPAVESDANIKLFCAPAGTGKTVLLVECLQELVAASQVIWIPSLATLQDAESLTNSLCQKLNLRDGKAETLLQVLARQDKDLHLVLDDYCRNENSEVDDLLLQLVSGSSEKITWWISSRRPLHHRFARLILEGHVFIYQGPSCLAFSQNEMDALAEMMSVSFTPKQHLQVMQNTHGWCIAVRAELNNPGNSLEALTHYLQNEFFRTLGQHETALFQLFACLGVFNVQLVNYITESCTLDIQKNIDCLVGNGAFIESVPQSKGFYSVYPPLSEHIRQRQLANSVSWYLKASQWHASQGQWQLAVEHALRAGYNEEALSMVQKVTDEESMSGDNVAVLMHLHDTVSRDILYSTPRLTALICGAQIFAGQLDSARISMSHFTKFLPAATATQQQSILAQWQAFQGWTDHLEGRSAPASEHLQHALQLLSTEYWEIALTCYSAQTQQALLSCDFAQARTLNRTALHLARQHKSVLLEAYLELDHAQLLEHRAALDAALSILSRVIQLLHENNALHSPVLGRLYIRMGQLQIRMGKWDEAQHSLNTGLREALHWGDHRALYGHCGLAFIALSQNLSEQAFAHLRDAERSMQKNHIPEAVYRPYLLFASSVFYIHQEKPLTAEKTLHEIIQHFTKNPELAPPPASFELIPRCHLYLAICQIQLKRLSQAKSKLQKLLTYAEQNNLVTLATETRCLLNLCLYREHAVHITSVDHSVFSECHSFGLNGFPQEVLRLFSSDAAKQNHSASSFQALSTREISVLRLVEQGLTNKQIADRMHISLHTVKTHLQRIYKKIHVSRRTQAVAKAKQLGVI